MAFRGGGSNDLPGDVSVEARAPARCEGFLHAPIFTGMKSEHGHAPAGLEARGKVAEEGFERRELVVDRDAESLEDAAEGQVAGVTGEAWQGGADGGAQGAGAGEAAARKGIGERTGVRLVGVPRFGSPSEC